MIKIKHCNYHGKNKWNKKIKLLGRCEKMIECEECGKALGIFEGYRHPTMGKKHLLCSPCFDQVNESVARWREFVLANSFNTEGTSYSFNKMVSSFTNLNDDLKNVFKTILSGGKLL